MADLVVTLTSNTTPSPNVATADSVFTNSASYQPWKAFDGLANSRWWSAIGFPHTLSYDFGSGNGEIVKGYVIVPYDTTYPPEDWTFEGWNGSDWDVLDTQTDITDWTAGEGKGFEFSNSTSYEKYRLNISSGENSTYITIAELELHDEFGEDTRVHQVVSEVLIEASTSDTQVNQVVAETLYLPDPRLEVGKAVGYAVISPPNDPGPVVAKAVGYAVLSTEVSVGIAKAVGYAVLEPDIALDGTVKVSQLVTEVLTTDDPEAKVSQLVAEVLTTDDPEAKVSQLVVEVMQPASGPEISKGVIYSVLHPDNTLGPVISKGVIYSVLVEKEPAEVSKNVVYSVLHPDNSLGPVVSKTVTYSVLAPPPELNSRPVVFIIT